MQTIREETRGKLTLRLLKTEDGYAAFAFSPDKQMSPIRGDDPEELWRRLLAEAGSARSGYVGIDGAVRRFLREFPGGFADSSYIRHERDYKVAARQYLNAELPLERARNATMDDCAAVMKAFGRTNLLSTFEHARVREILKSAEGPAFVQASAAVADGDFGRGLSVLKQIIEKYGTASWPVATYLPFFWRPQTAMFLKPEVTKDFAIRIGHRFADDYAPDLSSAVYESLLALTAEAEAGIAPLAPADRVDVQSFIWVIGAYDDAEANEPA